MKKQYYLFILAIVIFVGCYENKTKPSTVITNQTYTNGNSSNSNYTYPSTSTSSDNSNTYKYEYRTGSSRNYEYNYDVNGSDEDGNGVNGNIDMQGKYGSGTIQDEDGNEKTIDAEWTGKGQIEATDEDGNTYQLEVDP